MRLLLIEDEKRMAQALCEILRLEKYEVDHFSDGLDGLSAIESNVYDVVILDVMLPVKNGYTLVRDLRNIHNQTPVILLTARGSINDKVLGLESGADDFLTKPFAPAELLARLQALLRRSSSPATELAFGDLLLSLSTHELSCTQQCIHLCTKEFEIARALMQFAGNLISKETLAKTIWGDEAAFDDNNIEAYISFLRKKLRFLGSRVNIDTVRMAGYRLSYAPCDAPSGSVCDAPGGSAEPSGGNA